jgi:hypothetical protein
MASYSSSAPQSTVSIYMVPQLDPPLQTWKTSLRNHAERIDLFVVPTVAFQLFALPVLGHQGRQLLWLQPPEIRRPSAGQSTRAKVLTLDAKNFLVQFIEDNFGNVMSTNPIESTSSNRCRVQPPARRWGARQAFQPCVR